MDPGRHAAGELQEAARRRELEGREGESPGQRVSASQVPKVFVSLQPAEMILLRGKPSYAPVGGDEAPVGEQHRQRRFPDGSDRPVYFLVSGRWFSAPDFMGPWTFATRAPARRVQADPA